MSLGILVIGESGAGKTTSLRTLDPKNTFIIDCDKKGLNWRGWRKQYAARVNYYAESDPHLVASVLHKIATDAKYKHIATIVVDTLNGIMVDDEFNRRLEKGYDKWADVAWSVYDIISRATTYRDDLTVVCICHSQTDREDGGYMFTRAKTSGRKLDKIVIESKFTTVLLATASGGKYVFKTHADHSTAKTPFGAFDADEVPNDMQAVIETLRAYEKGE